MREPEMTRSTTDPELDLCDDDPTDREQESTDIDDYDDADDAPPPSPESAELANIANLERHCGNCETEWLGLKEQCKEAKELYDSAVVELRRAIRSASERHPLFDEPKHAQGGSATPPTDSLPPGDRPESNGQPEPLRGQIPTQTITPSATGRAFHAYDWIICLECGERRHIQYLKCPGCGSEACARVDGPGEVATPKPRRGRKGGGK